VSALVAKCGRTLNLSHHAWYFPDELFPEVMGGRRVEVPVRMGAFTYPGSGVRPNEGKVCLPFQCLGSLPMTVHPQKGRGRELGGLCCSPNNARFEVVAEPAMMGGDAEPVPSLPISHLWTVGVAGRPGGASAQRAVVSLQWVVHGPVPELAFLRGARGLGDVLHQAGEVFGHHRPFVQAAHGMFGFTGPHGDARGFPRHSGYGLATETPPLRRQDDEKGGKRGGQGRGQGRGGGGGGRGAQEGGREGRADGGGGGSGLLCAGCGKAKPPPAYTNNQLKKNEARKCRDCVDQSQKERVAVAGPPGSVSYAVAKGAGSATRPR
jgi:hypothetical protein